VRDAAGKVIGRMEANEKVDVWEEVALINGYKDRVVIDPPNAGVRRNIFAQNVRRL